MSYKMYYDNDKRLVISDVVCSCGCVHNKPEQDIYVGNGIIENTARYIRKRGYGDHCVLVADNNTWELAGKHVAELLRNDGFTVVECVVTREGRMDPDETAVGEVLLSMQPDTDFLVSVGSGAITDITRVNAKRAKLPQVCIGTAASMDGYTSSVCPLTFKGVKIHREGKCPEIIICDIDIIKTAPMDMVCAGVGDVLGKFIAKADWKIGGIINDEVYCPACGEIVTDAVNKLLDNLPEIKSRSDKGIQILTEALLLSGMTIMLIGHTRAVASVEHNVAHYWEMVQLQRKKTPPSHGSSVGVATLLVLPVFKKFAEEDVNALDENAPVIERKARIDFMYRAYGKAAADSIISENEGDFLTREEQTRRVKRAKERFNEIKQVIDELPSYEKLESAMRYLGSELTYKDCGIDDELLNMSMRCAKDYRTRYTLFKLINECGLEDKYLAEYKI